MLTLGAFNKTTGQYVYPNIANKTDKYICPDCEKELILCQGQIRKHYFRHKVDAINPCHRYTNPSESQIHKDAKFLMKTLLERKIPISLMRKCITCDQSEEFEIPEITELSKIELEYRFDYKGVKIADIAYIDNGEIFCIFEIYNTHLTSKEKRPEPWFEINAKTLINIANNDKVIIPCDRYEKCETCMTKHITFTSNIPFDVACKISTRINEYEEYRYCINCTKDIIDCKGYSDRYEEVDCIYENGLHEVFGICDPCAKKMYNFEYIFFPDIKKKFEIHGWFRANS